jgi:hypothetical protein
MDSTQFNQLLTVLSSFAENHLKAKQAELDQLKKIESALSAINTVLVQVAQTGHKIASTITRPG